MVDYVSGVNDAIHKQSRLSVRKNDEDMYVAHVFVQATACVCMYVFSPVVISCIIMALWWSPAACV